MKIARWVLVLMVTALLIPVTAHVAEVPGVTDTEVIIGITTPLSGPAALWGATAMGAKAWADSVNAKGGVHGRKIQCIIKDDAYNPTRGVANLEEMKGKIFACCGVLGTAVIHAAKDFFPTNKVPLICPLGNVRIWAAVPKEARRYVFVAYPDYEDEAEYITTYAVEKLNAKKIALFYQNDDYGKMALVGVNKALQGLKGKAELVAPVPYELTDRALGAHALKLKESGADTLIMYPTPTHGALITKEIAKIGYNPTRLATFTLGDPIMYKIAGEPWEGTYIALPGNAGIPGADPDADRIIETLLKFDPSIKGKEYNAAFGAMGMIHLVKGLENAGRDLTTESFIKGMEQIKDWVPENVGAPVTYNPERRHGVNASRMGQAKGGTHLPIEKFTIYAPRY